MKPTTYIRKMNTVSGWLHPITAKCLIQLDAEQKRLGVLGSSGEIGVHHGRLLILLALLEENSFAIDIFDDEKNVDKSGYGNRQIFERNLKKYCASTLIIQQDSRELAPNDLPGPVRLFSVDGSHTAEATLNDMQLADATLAQGGVMALDDYFNPRLPDVSIGANRYSGSLFPFAILPGKVLYTNDKMKAAAYMEATGGISVTMNGLEVKYISHRRFSAVHNNDLYKKLREKPYFQPIKNIARKIT